MMFVLPTFYGPYVKYVFLRKLRRNMIGILFVAFWNYGVCRYIFIIRKIIGILENQVTIFLNLKHVYFVHDASAHNPYYQIYTYTHSYKNNPHPIHQQYYKNTINHSQSMVQHQKNLAIILTIILAQTYLISTEGLYQLHLIPQTGGAACLDGSPPGYYIHEGLGDNKHNYILVFGGGGFCGQSTLQDTLQSCYKRSFGNLGSTKNQPQTKNATGMGILSTLQSQNPLFFDWTKIGVIYCDGSQYVGYRQNPINYRDKNLYFRGGRNVKQLFKELDNKYRIFDGGMVIITGVSAGGIASFQWSNYLLENTRKAKIYSMPDSGFFITDYYSAIVGKKLLRQNCQVLLNLVNNQYDMPSPILQCLQQPGFDIVDCFNAANYAKFLKTPIFMIQSPYDAWSMQNILGAQCLGNKNQPYTLTDCNQANRKVIEDYHMNSILQLNYIRNGRKDVGIWGPGCVQHGYEAYPSYNSQNYKVNETTLMDAIERFLAHPDKAEWLLDQRTWPENHGCSGLSQKYNLQFKLDMLSD